MKTKILTGTLALMLLAACSASDTLSPEAAEFAGRDGYGLYGNGVSYMEYQKYNHQIARNSSGTMFRMQNGNMSEWFVCKFGAKPTEGKNINVKIESHGIGSVESVEADFKAIKASDGKMWLWAEEEMLGIIICTE